MSNALQCSLNIEFFEDDLWNILVLRDNMGNVLGEILRLYFWKYMLDLLQISPSIVKNQKCNAVEGFELIE